MGFVGYIRRRDDLCVFGCIRLTHLHSPPLQIRRHVPVLDQERTPRQTISIPDHCRTSVRSNGGDPELTPLPTRRRRADARILLPDKARDAPPRPKEKQRGLSTLSKKEAKGWFHPKKTLLTRVLAKVYSPSVTAKHLLVDHVQVSGKHVFPRSVSSFGPIRTSNVTSSEPKSPVFKSRSRLYNFDSATRIPIPPGLRKTQFAEGQPTQVLLSHRDVVGQ